MRYTFALLALAVAVQASPVALPQGVTALVTPTGAAPPGCTPTYAGTFGIAAMNISTAAKAKRQIATISDGQPQVQSSAALITVISDGQPQAPRMTACAASQISDGQPQECTSTVQMGTMAPISQITDGQIQGGMHTMTMMPVSQISDGQPQGPTMTYAPVTVISDGQPQAPNIPTMTVCAASQIKDGQPQAACTMAACAASQIKDGQPQAGCTMTACAASQIIDGQPQGCTTTAAPVNTISDGQPQASTAATAAAASSTPYQLVACKGPATLELTLSNGILKDNLGRTGYIASNFQFQFDNPPQAGAIYTGGWSVCGNGSLALGGSNVFWQCLSGNFYNLYDRYWAPQCSPITIESLMLIDCS